MEKSEIVNATTTKESDVPLTPAEGGKPESAGVEIEKTANIIMFKRDKDVFNRATIQLEVRAKVFACEGAPHVWFDVTREVEVNINHDPQKVAAEIKKLDSEAGVELNSQVNKFLALMTKVISILESNNYAVYFEAQYDC